MELVSHVLPSARQRDSMGWRSLRTTQLFKPEPLKSCKEAKVTTGAQFLLLTLRIFAYCKCYLSTNAGVLVSW